MLVDDVGAVLVAVVPHGLEQLVAREDLAGVAHEHLEQRKALGRQWDLCLRAPHGARGGIEAQVAEGEHAGALDRFAAGQRSEPRGQLGEVKRFEHVVVGAAVQATDAIGESVAGGEHQDR